MSLDGVVPTSARGSARWQVVLSSLVVLAGSAYAAEQTRIEGGPGGVSFVDRPAPGARVGAIAIGAGAWIDSVAVVYETPDGQHRSNRHGGRGGSPCVLVIAPGERILGIRGRYGTYVESIQLITTRGVSRVCGGPGGGAEYRIDVPPGHDFVGLAGRAGDYVDAIGLALVPRGAAAPPPTPGAAPSPPPAAPAPKPAVPPPAATLSGKVIVYKKTNIEKRSAEATFQFRLTAPAPVQVVLLRRKLRSNECFAAGEWFAAYRNLPEAREHMVRIEGLQFGTDYSYAIRIGAAASCESGEFSTPGTPGKVE